MCLSTAKEELLVQNGKMGFYYFLLLGFDFFFSTKNVIANSRRGEFYTLSNDPTIGVSTESTRRPPWGGRDVMWEGNQDIQGDKRNWGY